MLSIILSVVSILILAAEFWLGVAVVGFSGDRIIIERANAPGPYWLMMALHTVIGVGLPVLAFMAGV